MRKSLKERTGDYGKAKFRVFACLEHRDWVCSRELILLSGLHYGSVSRLLFQYYSWDYLQRQLTYAYSKGTFEYRITERGLGWLAAARRDLPAAASFEADLAEWQSHIAPRFEELMAGPFKAVIEAVNSNGR